MKKILQNRMLSILLSLLFGSGVSGHFLHHVAGAERCGGEAYVRVSGGELRAEHGERPLFHSGKAAPCPVCSGYFNIFLDEPAEDAVVAFARRCALPSGERAVRTADLLSHSSRAPPLSR